MKTEFLRHFRVASARAKDAPASGEALQDNGATRPRNGRRQHLLPGHMLILR